MKFLKSNLWLWTVTGIVLGAMAGVVRYCMPMNETPEFRAGITPTLFVNTLRGFGPDGVRDLTIYPALDGKNYVRGEIVAGFGNYKPFQFNAHVPFEFGAAIPGHDIRDYLTKSFPKVSYRYAWWATPGSQALLWGIPSSLVLGILLTLAGKRRTKSGIDIALIDNSSSGSTPTPSLQASPPDPTAVEEFNEQLADGLSGREETVVASGSTAEAKREIPILSNKPLQTAVLEDEKAAKEYKGEFYPVSRKNAPPSD